MSRLAILHDLRRRSPHFNLRAHSFDLRFLLLQTSSKDLNLLLLFGNNPLKILLLLRPQFFSLITDSLATVTGDFVSLVNDFDLLVDHLAGKPIDCDVDPITLFTFHNKTVLQTRSIRGVTAALSDYID